MALRGKFFCAIALRLLPYRIYWESSWSMCLSVFNLSSVLVGLSVWMIMNLWKIDFHQSIFTTFMNFHEHSWTLPHELWPFFYEVDSTSRLGRFDFRLDYRPWPYLGGGGGGGGRRNTHNGRWRSAGNWEAWNATGEPVVCRWRCQGYAATTHYSMCLCSPYWCDCIRSSYRYKCRCHRG